MTELIGQTLGQYTLESVIGKGGMALVYSAVQKPLNRMVAVKVMKKDIIEDEEFAERFEREVKLLVDLEHPHIVPVIDFGNQNGQIYIVMRRIDGGSLHQRLKVMGALPLPTIAKILQHVGSALAFAHQKGIVHRDMKPSNVMLDGADNAYLTDFGIAKILASTTQLTASNTVLGTPVYMAPEQWRGEDLDARTDIYALGIMSYEMVTGKPPYEGDTSFTLMYKHFNEMPPLPTQVVADLPPTLEAVIMRAIAKAPEERFQSAEDFAEAFRRASEGKSVVLPEVVKAEPKEAPAVFEDDRPTINVTENQTAPYPSATEPRNPITIFLVAALGALFILVGIGIGIILPMVQSDGEGNEPNEAAEIALLTLQASQSDSPPPTLVAANTIPQGGGAQRQELARDVYGSIPDSWVQLEREPFWVWGDNSGNSVTTIRTSPRNLGRATNLNLRQIFPNDLESTAENLALLERFEPNYTLEPLEGFIVPVYYLSGISSVEGGVYADYYFFQLEDNEWLVLLSRHVLRDSGYERFKEFALKGLLDNLAVDNQLLRAGR